jgi:hypothetical protein
LSAAAGATFSGAAGAGAAAPGRSLSPGPQAASPAIAPAQAITRTIREPRNSGMSILLPDGPDPGV